MSERPRVAIIVATRDRARYLARLLASARAMPEATPARAELVVADNGSRDDTADVVRAAAGTEAGALPIRHLPVPEGGKTRALNVAIRATEAPLLGFVDDDVELAPGWLAAVEAFCDRTEALAVQGTIRVPPAAAADPAMVAELARWRTIPFRDFDPDVTEVAGLTGANMIIPRATFARVGLFDERLGPGAAGACEDTELSERIRAAGGRIAYARDAVVYHAVDPSRLSAAYFRRIHHDRGRSRVYYKRLVPSRVVPNLAVSAVGVALAWPGGTERRRRALARWYHYRGMLTGLRAPRLDGGAPKL